MVHILKRLNIETQLLYTERLVTKATFARDKKILFSTLHYITLQQLVFSFEAVIVTSLCRDVAVACENCRLCTFSWISSISLVKLLENFWFFYTFSLGSEHFEEKLRGHTQAVSIVYAKCKVPIMNASLINVVNFLVITKLLL